MNVPKESTRKNDIFVKRLFVNQPIAIGRSVAKTPEKENLKLEKKQQTIWRRLYWMIYKRDVRKRDSYEKLFRNWHIYKP